jgi:putative intracellular protease/amidase
MSKKEAKDVKQAVDEHGLVVHQHLSTVLVVVPPRDYAETTMRYARSALYNVHVHTWSVSSDDQALIKGELQDEFQVDGRIAEARMEAFSGVLFCGGVGALDLARDADALRLAREALAQDKLIGAWGHAVLVLAAAGVIRKRKVTGDPSLADQVASAGGKYTGVQVQRDGKMITALDDAAGLRFGKALVEIVRI